MVDASKLKAGSEGAANVADLTDRRRPGRRTDVSPELVPLLRGEFDPAIEDGSTERADTTDTGIEFDEPDQLRGSRGLVAGLAISGALWAAVWFGGRWLLH